MQLVFLIISVIQINVLFSSASEDTVKQVATDLLSSIENLKKEMENIRVEANRLGKSLLDLQLQERINSLITENKIVLQGKNILAEGKAKNDSNVAKCEALFDLQLEWLLQKINQFMKITINNDLLLITNSVKLMNKDLGEIQSEAEKILKSENADSACSSIKPNCDLLKRSSDDIKLRLQAINQMEEKLLDLIPNFLNYLQGEESYILIREKVLIPVINCL